MTDRKSKLTAHPMQQAIFMLLAVLICCCRSLTIDAQANTQTGAQYSNPVLHADFSDPDAIRDGDTYYMVASSFNSVPGLPILESKDLINWRIRSYALSQLVPAEHFKTVRHGGGVWAPSIRKHKGVFYIFYPDPDFGIYVLRSSSIDGPWSQPQLVMEGRGLIDPCPLWDADGKAYMAFAFAGSRAGVKSVLAVVQLNPAVTTTIGQPVLVYDGHDADPTIEGPKFYKRNGYYYLFAPAGGVSTGWQTVLRSKNIYGPYERKIVMAQGSTPINGPHQGAWVTTPAGQDWFLHFQDKEAYGRIVHLQPMQWKNDWPVIGHDANQDGTGEPVLLHARPQLPTSFKHTLQTTDEFNTTTIGLQWQWQANPDIRWAMPSASGYLTMPAILRPDSLTLYTMPNVLSQKFPATAFTATAKIDFRARNNGEAFHFIVLGTDYATISIHRQSGKLVIKYTTGIGADKNKQAVEKIVGELSSSNVYLRIQVTENALCKFSFSENGDRFTEVEGSFVAKPGKWVGAKLGMACIGEKITNDAGFARIDWFRVVTQ